MAGTGGGANRPKMHLAQFLVHGPTWHSLAMWRHPKTAAASAARGFAWDRPELYQHIARTCERGLFDTVFFADLNYIADTYTGTIAPALRNATQAPEHDPIPLLSYMAAVTERIGVASTFSVSHSHPFYAARLWATLDHLTRGRAGWNVVTSINSNQAANYGEERQPTDARYDRAHEFMEVCRQLWESWDEDAVVMDREAAVFADPAKVRRIEYEGRFFKLARPAQRDPLAPERPRDLPGRHLAQGPGLRREDTRTRSSRSSLAPWTRRPTSPRSRGGCRTWAATPDECRILFGMQPILGATEAEARERQEEHNDLVPVEGRHGDPLRPPRPRPRRDTPRRDHGRSVRSPSSTGCAPASTSRTGRR